MNAVTRDQSALRKLIIIPAYSEEMSLWDTIESMVPQ